jgi:hypothetical protein
VWQRRAAALVVIAVIPLPGLLIVFGQRAVFDSTQSPAASMLINSPAHVRGGGTELMTVHRTLTVFP